MSFRVCRMRIRAYVLLHLGEINRSCGGLRACWELHRVLGRSSIRTQLVLWIHFPPHPSFPLSFLCICFHVCKPDTRENNSLDWTCLKKPLKENELLPLGWNQKDNGSLKCCWWCCGRKPGQTINFNLSEMPVCQISIHLCCEIGFQARALRWVSMSPTFIFIAPNFFFFSFPSIEKALPSHSMNCTPEPPFICGSVLAGEPHRSPSVLAAPGPALTHLRILWCGSSCFKGTLPLRCPNYRLFSPLEELREGRCLSFV